MQNSRSTGRGFRLGSIAEALIVVVVLVGGTAVSWQRLGPVVRSTVWAEDGNLFLQQLLNLGPGATLFHPYAGYLQFLPRVLTDLAMWIGGFSHYAATLNLLSCISVAVIAALVFLLSKDVMPSVWLRLLLAMTTILIPGSPIEVLGNAANIHWYFLWLAPWLFLYRPKTNVGTALVAVVALVATLTEIQLVIFLPLFIVNRRSVRSLIVAGAAVIGLLAELASSLLNPRGSSGSAHTPTIADIVSNYFYQCVLALYPPGPGAVQHFVSANLLGWSIAAFVPFALALAFVIWKGSPAQRFAAVGVVLASAALWSAGAYLNDYRGLHRLATPIAVFRYAVVPQLLLLSVLVIAAQVALQRSRKTWRIGAIALSVLTVVILVGQFTPSTYSRAGGPIWRDSIALARTVCATPTSGSTGPPSATNIIVAPIGPAVWFVRVPCDDLVP